MTRSLGLLLALLGLALTACGTATSGDGSSSPRGDLAGEWTLADGSVGGKVLVPPDGSPITLEIAGSDASGRSACNTYTAKVAVDGEAVRFDGLGGTEMGCDPEVMAVEQAYLDALRAVRAAAVDGEVLVLTGDGVELRYAAVEPPKPAALVGVRWTLDAVLGGSGPDGSASSAVGEPATLVLAADGSLTGSTGCNDFSASYEVEGGTLHVAGVITTEVACLGAAGTQQDAVLAVLAEATVGIDGRVLTLTAPDGRGLVYRAAAARDDPPGEPTSDPASDGRVPSPLGSWLLRTGSTAQGPIEVGDGQARLELVDGRLRATAGCNWLEGGVVVDGATISAGKPGMSTTFAACPHLDLENAFFAALALPLTFELDRDQLVLRGDGGELVLDRGAGLAPTSVVGRTWVLEQLVGPDGTALPMVGTGQLVLADDGTWTATLPDCAMSGTYAIEGLEVVISELHVDGICSATSSLMPLHSAFAPIVDGDTMVMTLDAGAGSAIWVVERPGE